MVEGQEGVGWDDWLATASAVESAGLYGLFRSDHYTSFHGEPGPALDAWATICGLAARTQRIRLGTLVSPATFRRPSELARVVVTADHISGGRVELGVGAGWFEKEHKQNGFPFPPTPERFAMFAECVEVLVGSWSAEEFNYQGRYFTLEGQRALPAGVQSPHPPLIFGGRGGPRSLDLAARHADEYNAAFLLPEEAAALRTRLDGACRACGRAPDSLPLSMMTLVAVGEDGAEAEARLTRMLSRFRAPRERSYVGSVADVVPSLRALEGAGVAKIYVQHPDLQDLRSVSLLGQLAGRLL
jgi:alkanesulfonate monooxygenase SsuD/methylene tetrahydromethanopterin reductase-like flavin-dependent oxidoreductase (luciferase family)